MCISWILSTLSEGTGINKSTLCFKLFAFSLVKSITFIPFFLDRLKIFKIFLLFPDVVIANSTSPFFPNDSICR